MKNKYKKFGPFKINDSYPIIIAEAGVNHEGKFKDAVKLIKFAKKAGADAIKFQTYKASEIAIENSPAYWDTKKEKTKNQKKLFSKFDKLNFKDYKNLYQISKKLDIEFMTTLFSEDAVKKYGKLIRLIKVASADITNVPLLKEISKLNKPVIISTGASNIAEIKNALKILNLPKSKICIMHCVLNYPTVESNANLAFIKVLKKIFKGYLIGYSDHTIPKDNILSLQVAWENGAQIIEKHFTLDKKKKGNDHYHAMSYTDLINFKKILSEKIKLQGNGKKNLRIENDSILFARRSIVAKKNILKGEIFSSKNLTGKRPGIYTPIKQWDKFIGKKANKNINEDEPIMKSHIM